jgi:uncharacterized membrane protein YdjX (TVP38/TMEM64 family)
MKASAMRAPRVARAAPPREAAGTTGRPLPGAAGPARWLPLVVVAAALAFGYAFGLHEMLSPESLARNRGRLEAFVAGNTALAAVAYVGVYVLAVGLSFPGASFLTIAGGMMFGWLLGGALTAVAATAGACLIFLVARTSLGDLLQRRAGGRLARLGDGFRENAFSYLLFLRLAPVFPFWLVNLAPALFGMRLGAYALATFLGILPGTFAYAYFGQGLGTALDGDGPIVSTELLAGFGALALAALLPVLLKAWRARRHAAR